MALGGGVFLTQNKILPGAYINFVSASRASATIADRGVGTLPLILNWGAENELIEVDQGQFQKSSLEIFGYDPTHPTMRPIREFFQNARVGYFWRLNGGGAKAKNKYATAKYSGTRGNDLTIIISHNADEPEKWDVETAIGSHKVDLQTVSKKEELAANKFLNWNADMTLEETAGTPLAGGTNAETVNGESYQKYLTAAEGVAFNTMGIPSKEKAIVDLAIAYTKRMRDEVGVKFQTVVFNRPEVDYEGIISVGNEVRNGENYALVYWVTGAQAGCPVNKSLTNRIYNGEYDIETRHTQRELERGMTSGSFLFHRVGDRVRVLADVDTFTSATDEKSRDFGENQTIRVLDQIANDIAKIFVEKYLGQVPNDNAGRMSLWADIVKHHKELEQIRAIQDFDPDRLKVEQGDHKRAVKVTDIVNPVNAMAQLYMTVIVE